LKRTVHAGESSGPEGVRDAIELLGADRIDHGGRAIEDPAVVGLLAERQIPLGVCPSSNVTLGLYPALTAHPIDRLRRAGVPVSVNTDDPALLGVTLAGEYDVIERAGENLDYCRGGVGLLQAAFEAFVGREDERQLRAADGADLFDAELAGDPTRQITVLGEIVSPTVGIGGELAGKVRTARRREMHLREVFRHVEDRLRQSDAVTDDEIVAALGVLANDRLGTRRIALLLACRRRPKRPRD
jgi:hypothetical protein